MAIVEKAGSALGTLAAAPWNAALSVLGNAAGAALSDTPSTTTSGSGPFMGGTLTVGAKNVGSGKQDANTSSSPSQTPISESPGATAVAGGSIPPKYIYIGATILGILFIISLFRRD